MSSFQKLHNYKYYLIHDNYSRPFCVYIDENQNEVHIYKEEYDNEEYDNENIQNYKKLIGIYKPQKIFIGESPVNEMTLFSGGHGPTFQGNSILLQMDRLEYIFIGECIYSFKTEYELVSFVSPVGNNDVPYPYAIDTEDNYYFLLIEISGIGILKVIDDYYKENNPYWYYYNMLNKLANSENIECIYINEEQFKITSNPTPDKHYDDLTKRIGSPMYIKYNGEEKKIISKHQYIELLENYNKKIGLASLLDIKIIHKRIW